MAEKNARRDSRAEQARRHIEDMERRFSAEIARAVADTRAYDAAPTPAVEGVVPEASVVSEDGVSAVLARGRGLASACDLAILDFASFTRPGGGYDRGTWGQEQALCASSFLFNVLSEKGGWYAENRRRNINCELYRNRALVVPRVRFERDGFHSYADVIVAAAPNARRAREEYRVSDDALLAALRSGHLRGAALDVTDPEPLPAGHPLWHEPRAVITPHVSGGFHMRDVYEKLAVRCIRNLAAFTQGRPYESVVDRSTGYTCSHA